MPFKSAMDGYPLGKIRQELASEENFLVNDNLSIFWDGVFQLEVNKYKGKYQERPHDLKILKVKYLSSNWSDLPLNLSSRDQTKIKAA